MMSVRWKFLLGEIDGNEMRWTQGHVVVHSARPQAPRSYHRPPTEHIITAAFASDAIELPNGQQVITATRALCESFLGGSDANVAQDPTVDAVSAGSRLVRVFDDDGIVCNVGVVRGTRARTTLDYRPAQLLHVWVPKGNITQQRSTTKCRRCL
jgi:hypothetical protein